MRSTITQARVFLGFCGLLLVVPACGEGSTFGIKRNVEVTTTGTSTGSSTTSGSTTSTGGSGTTGGTTATTTGGSTTTTTTTTGGTTATTTGGSTTTATTGGSTTGGSTTTTGGSTTTATTGGSTTGGSTTTTGGSTTTTGGTSGTTTGGGGPATLNGLQVAPSLAGIADGTSVQFSATGTYSNGATQDLSAQVTWTASPNTVATISATGLAAGVGAGSATISAAFGGLNANGTLVVSSATLSSLAVSPATVTVPAGIAVQAYAIGTFSDGTNQDLSKQVIWNSNTTGTATVDANGLVTGVASGAALLTATFGSTVAHGSVTVTAATLSSIDLSPPVVNLARGFSQQMSAVGLFSDGSFHDITTQVTWSVTDTNIATVSNVSGTRGWVSAVAAGGTSVTATLSSVENTATVQVSNATLSSLELAPANISLALGLTHSMSATGVFSNGAVQDLTTQVLWSVSDGNVLSISNARGTQGVAIGLAVGNANVLASVASTTASTSITVTPATLTSLGISPTGPTLAPGTGLQLDVVGVFSDFTTQDLTHQVTWGTSDATIGTVSNTSSNAGFLSAVATGNIIVSATLNSNSTQDAVSVSTATLSDIDLSPSNANVALGTTLQFTALGTFSDASTQDLTTQVTYYSSNPNVAVVSQSAGTAGVLTPLANGNVTIGVSMGNVNGTGIANIVVTSAALKSIAVTPTVTTLYVNGQQQYVATASFTDGTLQDVTAQATWNSTSAGVASVSNASSQQGLATGISAGNSNVTATFSGVTGVATLTVSGATLTSVTVAPQNANVPKGFTVPFTATAHYSDGSSTDVTSLATWTSSSTVAAVSNSTGSRGYVTGSSVGTASINAIYGGQQPSTPGMANVTGESLSSIAVTSSPAGLTVNVGSKLQLIATGTFSGGTVLVITNQCNWQSQSKNLASITKQGLVTGIKAGSARIKVSKGHVTVSPTTIVTVN